MKIHKEQGVLVVVIVGNYPIVVSWASNRFEGYPFPRPARFCGNKDVFSKNKNKKAESKGKNKMKENKRKSPKYTCFALR